MHNNKRQNFYVYVTPKKEKMFTAFLAQPTKKKLREIVKYCFLIVDVIVTLGKRNIGLRGSWDKVKKKEDGNFQFFVDWKAVFDQDLKHHIEKGARNAQYISPTTQNELIACCEAEIRDSIIEKCKEAPFFSLCADETTDVSVTEQLSFMCEIHRSVNKWRFVRLSWLHEIRKVRCGINGWCYYRDPSKMDS